MAESFFGTLQLELLDEHTWPDRDTLARAIFEWIIKGGTTYDAVIPLSAGLGSTPS